MLILHIGDTHFSSKRLADKIVSANQLVAAARDIRPDIICHAGDAFDAPIRCEDLAALAAFDFFSSLADIAPIILNKGNEAHDRGSVNLLQFVRGKYPLIVVTEASVIRFTDRDFPLEHLTIEAASRVEQWQHGAVFCLLPYPNSSFLAKTATLSPVEMKQAVSSAITEIMRGFAALPLPARMPRLLVYHGTVKGAKYSESQTEIGMDIELSPFDIGACNFDLTLAAHLHYKQEIPTSSGSICYPGGMTYLCVGDDGPKGAWVHEIIPGDSDKPVLVKSRHVAVDAVPIKVVNWDMSDPFCELPEWAATLECDIHVRVKLTEKDREALREIDWKVFFPKARTIDIEPHMEHVANVRCEEVRTAKTLRDKIRAWGLHQGEGGQSVVTESILEKATLLESIDDDGIVAVTKEKISQ